MTRCDADVVVIGSGIAGLTFALRVAEGASVLLVTKKERAQSNTNYAQGGIAVVVGADDELRLHVEDTLLAGAGLCHADVVRAIVAEGPACVRDLAAWGTAFHRSGDVYSLGREGGHSRRRIVHAGDRTGEAIESALLSSAERIGLRVLEDHIAVDLLTERDPAAGPHCVGVRVLDEASGEEHEVRAPIVLLATGGCGQIYRHTTNPPIATGDGVAMAYRAGARIANMEFIQFHPTALHPTEDPAFLISEAVRGEGAVLRRLDGRAFMDDYHPLGSLAPRDVVARAIVRELDNGGDDHVVLDIGAIDPGVMGKRFPATLEGCRARGIEPERDGIPVVPAAHYACGGVQTDLEGRTSLPGLLAAGEVACTGLHGANRLASNSLLEAVVVAHRASVLARDTLKASGRWTSRPCPPDLPSAAAEPGGEGAPAGRQAEADADPGPGVRVDRPDPVRELMWARAGIVRTRARLEEAREELEAWVPSRGLGASPTPADVQARNRARTALLIVRSALRRRESRGLHYTLDYPYRDNERCLADTVLERDEEAP